jgi:hypothetical protein
MDAAPRTLEVEHRKLTAKLEAAERSGVGPPCRRCRLQSVAAIQRTQAGGGGVRGVRRGGVHYGRCWYGGSQVRIADDVVPRYVMPCLDVSSTSARAVLGRMTTARDGKATVTGIMVAVATALFVVWPSTTTSPQHAPNATPTIQSPLLGPVGAPTAHPVAPPPTPTLSRAPPAVLHAPIPTALVVVYGSRVHPRTVHVVATQLAAPLNGSEQVPGALRETRAERDGVRIMHDCAVRHRCREQRGYEPPAHDRK